MCRRLDGRDTPPSLSATRAAPGEKLVYAYLRLPPIWERWTDGNLAMRRALECDSADPVTHEERRNILFHTQCRFQGRGDSPANMAATDLAASRYDPFPGSSTSGGQLC